MRRDVLLAGRSAVGLAPAGRIADPGEESAEDDDATGEGGGDTEGGDAVSMASVGELTVESAPGRVTTSSPGYVDMRVALGVEDTPVVATETDRHRTGYSGEIDGVPVREEELLDVLDEGGIDGEEQFDRDRVPEIVAER